MVKKLSEWMGAQDMTVGVPWKNLVQFSIPLLIGNIAQQLYNTVDAVVVGNFVGDNALAAVGACMPVINLLIVLFMAIATGSGIMVSQFFGAKDRDMLSKTVGTCLMLTALAGILMTVVGMLVSRPLLALLNTPDNIIQMSGEYLVIIFAGVLGTAFYNIISGVLRGLGDSVMPLVFLLVASFLNIVLDLFFVIQFDMGVAGVAWATIIAQAISAVLCVVRLASMRGVLDLNKSTLKIHKGLAQKIAQLGLPSGVTQAVFSMAMLMVQSLANSFGTHVVATNTMVMRVDGFAMMPNFTFGMAMTTFAGQNIGARQYGRVKEGTVQGLKMGLVVSVVLAGGILVFGESLLRIFTDSEEIIALGVHQMRILCVGYIAMAVTQILSGTMRGAGDTLRPMWISLVTTVAVRVPIAYLWAYATRSDALPNGSPDALYYSLMTSWVLGALITTVVYARKKWLANADLTNTGSAVTDAV